MSWETYLRFPVAYKKWYIERINKEIEKAAKANNDIQTKAPQHNPPDIRALTGKVKPATSSARMQRFT